MNGSTCRYCGAEIVWGKTEAYRNRDGTEKPAKNMPLDPDDQQVVMRTTGEVDAESGAPIVRFSKGYVPHWATCTNPPPRNR